MSSKLFTLKVLSSSPDAGIRTLRGFAASMGGSAELLPPKDFDPSTLAASSETPTKTVLLIDANTPDGQQVVANLPAVLPDHVTAFAMTPPDQSRKIPSWASGAQLAGVVVGGSVAGLDYAAVRCILSCFVRKNCVPDASSFLRWGYASSLWTPVSKVSIVSSFAEFMQKNSLPPAAEKVHLAFTEITERFLPAGGSIGAGLVASDGINCLTSVTLVNCAAIYGLELPPEISGIDAPTGTIVSVIHSPQLLELSMLRPVNGQGRGDGKSSNVRPANMIRMIAPLAKADAAPTMRIVWTEAG